MGNPAAVQIIKIFYVLKTNTQIKAGSMKNCYLLFGMLFSLTVCIDPTLGVTSRAEEKKKENCNKEKRIFIAMMVNYCSTTVYRQKDIPGCVADAAFGALSPCN